MSVSTHPLNRYGNNKGPSELESTFAIAALFLDVVLSLVSALRID